MPFTKNAPEEEDVLLASGVFLRNQFVHHKPAFFFQLLRSDFSFNFVSDYNVQTSWGTETKGESELGRRLRCDA